MAKWYSGEMASDMAALVLLSQSERGCITDYWEPIWITCWCFALRSLYAGKDAAKSRADDWRQAGQAPASAAEA